ncbi:MAG: hypothetical protein GY810_20060 [Aureispira sp.]|nr:hypothetical protein [Aureispira sp.]
MATRNVADIRAITAVEQNVAPAEAVNFNGSRGRGVRFVQYSEINIPLEQIQTKTTTTKVKKTPNKKVSKSKKRKRIRGRLYVYKPRRGLFANCPSF